MGDGSSPYDLVQVGPDVGHFSGIAGPGKQTDTSLALGPYQYWPTALQIDPTKSSQPTQLTWKIDFKKKR